MTLRETPEENNNTSFPTLKHSCEMEKESWRCFRAYLCTSEIPLIQRANDIANVLSDGWQTAVSQLAT